MRMSNPEIKYMSRALQLAENGLGLVRPNPVVGCVIVHNDRIIGEGFHHRFGGAHAEVEAINSVNDPSLLKESTVFVTLEPCSHHGKTPPCSDLLIHHRVKKVVVANVDPNPLVAGKGIKKMQSNGIEVITGVLKDQGRFLNRRFFTFHEQKRPFIVLKWAQTSDGFVARTNHDAKWISGTRSRQLVHRWRAEEAAILVGKNTVTYDDPSLTTRDWAGTHPLRIILDRKGSLDTNHHVFDEEVETIRFVTVDPKLKSDVQIDGGFLSEVLTELYNRNIQSVFVEGGAAILSTFIKQGLWDEARVFTSRAKFGEGIAAPQIDEVKVSEQPIETDLLSIYENKKT
jgi:diaminohydroxyphosphoribosylaminopyrimidine deaminase/5-amino-6-(5-phosphoribosylamino)uracil reductase